MTAALTFRRFAWGDLAFEVPEEWDLASCQQQGERARLQLSDSCAIRLTVEWWMGPRRKPLDPDRLRHRFDRLTRRLRQSAGRTVPLELSAPGEALLHACVDGRRVAVAFRPAPTRAAVALLQVHFPAEEGADAAALARRVIQSVTWQESPLRRWAFYDLNFSVPDVFRLLESSLAAGRKQMVFGWAGRRLAVSFHSLADHILRAAPDLWTWAAAEINRSGVWPELRWEARSQALIPRRRLFPRFPLSALMRGCRRYEARVEHSTARNMVALAVFNYRRPSDRDLFRRLQLFAAEG